MAIIGIGFLLSVLALANGAGMFLMVLTVLFAFLSIRMEGASILDFLRCAVCFLFIHQQYYEWKEEHHGSIPCVSVLQRSYTFCRISVVK